MRHIAIIYFVSYDASQFFNSDQRQIGGSVGYPNLSAEIKRSGMTQGEFASVIGRRAETVGRWLSGKTEIPIGEAFRIRDELFPGLTIDYLFANEPISVQ